LGAMKVEDLIQRISDKGVILIYGEGGVGKTTLTAQILSAKAKQGLQVAYLYSSELSLARFKAVFEEASSQPSMIIKITDLQLQDRSIEALYRARGGGLGAVAIDTLTDAYRSYVASKRSPIQASKLLNQQLAMLATLAEEEGLTVIVTSRARRLAEDLEPEASSLLEYWAHVSLRLERLGKPGYRRIIIEKGPAKLRGEAIEALITKGGFR